MKIAQETSQHSIDKDGAEEESLGIYPIEAVKLAVPNAGRYRQIYKSKNGTIYKLIII